MRRSGTRTIAIAAVLAAFETAFAYIACVFPTGQLGFLGVASLFGVAAVVELGTAAGAAVYAVAAVLGLILLPSKTLALLFAVSFGPYPVVKALAEGRGRVAEWAVKLGFFNLAMTLAVFALDVALPDLGGIRFAVPILYVLGNLVFIIFDIAVSRALGFYMGKIHPKIRKR